jgi:Flp pilus assembly protein CpaB
MNPRQRRGMILLALAVLGGLAVFFSVLTFVADVNAKVGDLTSVVELSAAAPAYQPVTADMLTLKEVPRKWLPDEAITDARDVVGLVPTNDLAAGTFAQRGMFVNRPGVASGYREVAVMLDAETGVAGKIKSGDRVDIITTSESGAQADQDASRKAEVWVANALIIEVGVPETVQESRQNGFSEGKAVPVTFALPVSDALKVAYAESFSVKVRLALRGGGDTSEVPRGDSVFPTKGKS